MATKRSYQDACRFAYALDLVGERWALLIVRELLLGPKRFTDLRTGLPHASTNIVYELTEWGRDLEPVVTQLGAWGARSPLPPDAQTIGPDSAVLALGSLFDAGAAGELDTTYNLRIGEDRFRVEIAAGSVELERGAAGHPAATLAFPDAPTMAAVLTAQLSLEDALASGALQIEGSRQATKRFLRLFPMPEPCVLGGAKRVGAPAGA
jgi:DNA-binding HxlR family transcriptional regulator